MLRKLEGTFVSALFAGTAFVGAWWGAHTWLPSLASRHGAGIDSTREEDRLRWLEVGANHYLTKSAFHDNSFVQTVEDLIGPA